MFSEISFCRFAAFRWLTGRSLFLIFPFVFLTVRFLMSDSVRSLGTDHFQRRVSPSILKRTKRRYTWQGASPGEKQRRYYYKQPADRKATINE